MGSNPLKRIFLFLLSFQLRNPLLIVAVAIALAALSVYYTASNLRIQPSQKDLISPKERLIQLAQQAGQFTAMDSFVIVIQGPTPSRSLEFLQALVPRLTRDRTNFKNVFYRVDPESIKPWALFYLGREDLISLTDSLKDHSDFIRGVISNPNLVNFFEQLNHQMASRMVGELFTGFLESKPKEEKPFDLGFLISVLRGMKSYLEGREQFTSPWNTFLSTTSFEMESTEGYFWTANKRYLLCFVTPASRNEFTGTWLSLSDLRGMIAELEKRFPDIQAGVTGPEALNADQMNTAISNMEVATFISLACLAVLFIFFRRGVRIPLLELITLVIALSWSFGLTTLLIGHLNILSITFAPLLLGLGVDFGAHWFARMREEELARPGSKKEIVRSTMLKIGPAMLLAGMSLTLAFLPLILTGFKGLAELGLICTLGMIVMAMASLLLLPSLVQLFAVLTPKAYSATPMMGITVPTKPFFRLTRNRALFILTIGTAAVGAASWSAVTWVGFDLNMLHLQAENVESVVWEKKLIEGSKISSIFGEVLAPTLNDVRIQTKKLEMLPSVSQTESVETLLPKDQEEKISILRKIRPLMEGLQPMKPSPGPVNLTSLGDILNRIKFKMAPASAAEWGANKPLARQMETVRGLIDDLKRAFDSPYSERGSRILRRFQTAFFADLNSKLSVLKANVESKPMTVKGLPEALRERYIARNGDFIIRVYPKEDIWQPTVLGRFVNEIRTVSPDAIGDPVTLFVFTQAFRDSAVMAAFYSLLFIFIFVLIVFRDLKATFLVLIPFLVGTAWTLGLMPPLGLSLNLANTMFLPLIVGAGVEYGIIIVSRWRQQEKSEEMILPQSTAMGVLLAGLSTLAGFSSLMISSHRGIFSLGLLTAIGSITVLIASLIYLPALMFFAGRRK